MIEAIISIDKHDSRERQVIPVIPLSDLSDDYIMSEIDSTPFLRKLLT